MKYNIYIDNQAISQNEIINWESKRLASVTKKLGFDSKTIEELTKSKQKLSYDEVISRLNLNLKISAITAKLMNALSFGKRKFCVVEMVVEGLTAEQVSAGLDKLMFEQNKEYDFINLLACPDHYALRPLGDSRLEVIETTGGSPFPIQFFINYGQEKELRIPRDNTYTFQSVGIAKLYDGTIIGGVRHQFKNEGKGFRAKLAVEFPLVSPNYFIQQHQLHLACEFGHWFKWLLEQNKNRKDNN